MLTTKPCGPAVEAEFHRDLARGSYGEIIAPSGVDLNRSAELVAQYADMSLGGTDACVIAVAERLDTETVATLNHRDFNVVRPRHVAALTLVPE